MCGKGQQCECVNPDAIGTYALPLVVHTHSLRSSGSAMCGYADVRMCGLAFETGVSLGINWLISWRAQGSPHSASDEAFG